MTDRDVMDDIDFTNSLLYGDVSDKLAQLQHVYAMYAMGDPVSVIAKSLGKTEPEVHRMMKTRPDDYEATKQAREAFIGVRLQRSVSLVDAMNLKKLEDWREGRSSPTIDELKAIDKWIKHASDRLALHEGKPTSAVKVDVSETLEEIEAWTKKVRAAGNGINLVD